MLGDQWTHKQINPEAVAKGLSQILWTNQIDLYTEWMPYFVKSRRYVNHLVLSIGR